MYRLLAMALSYPTDESLAELGELVAEEQRLPGRLSGLLREMASTAAAGAGVLGREHIRLFPPIESPDTAGYETAYRGDEIFNHTAVMADVAGFYKAFGLAVGGSTRQRPDHITVELEFLAFVSFKEALCIRGGDDEQADVCADAERAFLADHLGDWAPELGRRLKEHALGPFYRAAGSLLDRWVTMRLDGLGLEPNGSAGLAVSVPTQGSSLPDACGLPVWEPVEFKDGS